MNPLVIRWLTLTAAVLMTAYLLDGIRISGVFAALGSAAFIGISNAVLRPVAILLTLPLNILSLGLFTLVINAALLKLVSAVVPGFDVIGFWPAVFGSVLISAISWLLNAFIRERPVPDPRGPRHPDENVIDLRNRGNDHWE